MICVQMIALLESWFKMIDSYKNIERLRYRINKDLLAICDDIKKNNDEQRIMFIDECFSAFASSFASLFFSQVTFEPIKELLQILCKFFFKKTMPSLVITVITAVLCIIILIFVSVQINNILIYMKKRKRNKGPEGADTIDYVKEFDNIACDSVIVSIEYKEMYMSTHCEDEKTLYYLEIVHYLETASVIIEKLCADMRNIKSSKNVLGVDVYRVHNIKAVITDLCKFVEQERTNLALGGDDKNEIQKHLEIIKNRLDSICV